MGGKWSPDGVAAGRKSRILRKSRSDFLTGVVAAEGWSSEYRPSRRPGVEKPKGLRAWRVWLEMGAVRRQRMCRVQ